MFCNSCTNSQCLYSTFYLNWHPQYWRAVRLLNVPCQTPPLLYWVLTGDFSLCLFIPQTVNSPVLYDAILTLCLVALPGFLNISHFPGSVNVMSLVITAAPNLLSLFSVEAILIAQWSAECENTVPVSILEGADTRTSGIRGYCTLLLKNQDFWSMNSILKELYCVSEAPLDVLKVELWFILRDFNFLREQWFCLC